MGYLEMLYEFYDDMERDYNDRMTGEGDYADMPLSNPFEEDWWERMQVLDKKLGI